MNSNCPHDWYEYSESYTGSGCHCYICRLCQATVSEEPESHKEYRKAESKKYYEGKEANRRRELEIDHTGD